MKTRRNWLAGIIVTAASLIGMSSAFAGAEGHGGVAVVCRNAEGRIQTAELLDLFEARNKFGLTLPASDSTSPAELAREFARTMSQIQGGAYHIERALSLVEAKFFIMENETVIIPINDSFPTLKKKNCGFEQVAAFNDDGKLLIDREIYESMNSLNQAGLRIHEAMYYLARTLGKETNSIRARKMTGYLIAVRTDVENLRKEFSRWVTDSGLQHGTYIPKYPFSWTCPIVISTDSTNLEVRATRVEKCQGEGNSYRGYCFADAFKQNTVCNLKGSKDYMSLTVRGPNVIEFDSDKFTLE